MNRVVPASRFILYIHTVSSLTIMSKKSLPEVFLAPTVKELRALWRKYPDDEALRRTLMEIERLRDVIDRIDATRESIERVWKEEDLGTLASLHTLRILLGEEKRRAGRFG